MQRGVFYLRLFPGAEPEYDRRHVAIWPELADEIRESGLRNMSGFRRGTDVWYYVEAEPALRKAFAAHGPKPANQRWGRYFRDIIAEITGPDGDLLWYKEVFHAGGDSLPGPMRRGFFSLVIDPERASEYDAMHASPWPDLLVAIRDTGFRNYSGFRRGANVVYYGEFYPDIDTVFERMSKTAVDARWRRAFEGIITTIAGKDGLLIAANVVFHQD